MTPTKTTIDGKLLRYARQDGLSQWWKECITATRERAATPESTDEEERAVRSESTVQGERSGTRKRGTNH